MISTPTSSITGKNYLPGEEVRVARITAFVVGAIAIFSQSPRSAVNVAFLVGPAFAVAASANLPVIVFSIFWSASTPPGGLRLAAGLVSSIVLILMRPNSRRQRSSPRRTRAPSAFRLAPPQRIPGMLPRREPAAEAKFEEPSVRAQTASARRSV